MIDVYRKAGRSHIKEFDLIKYYILIKEFDLAESLINSQKYTSLKLNQLMLLLAENFWKEENYKKSLNLIYKTWANIEIAAKNLNETSSVQLNAETENFYFFYLKDPLFEFTNTLHRLKFSAGLKIFLPKILHALKTLLDKWYIKEEIIFVLLQYPEIVSDNEIYIFYYKCLKNPENKIKTALWLSQTDQKQKILEIIKFETLQAVKDISFAYLAKTCFQSGDLDSSLKYSGKVGNCLYLISDYEFFLRPEYENILIKKAKDFAPGVDGFPYYPFLKFLEYFGKTNPKKIKTFYLNSTPEMKSLMIARILDLISKDKFDLKENLSLLKNDFSRQAYLELYIFFRTTNPKIAEYYLNKAIAFSKYTKNFKILFRISLIFASEKNEKYLAIFAFLREQEVFYNEACLSDCLWFLSYYCSDVPNFKKNAKKYLDEILPLLENILKTKFRQNLRTNVYAFEKLSNCYSSKKLQFLYKNIKTSLFSYPKDLNLYYLKLSGSNVFSSLLKSLNFDTVKNLLQKLLRKNELGVDSLENLIETLDAAKWKIEEQNYEILKTILVRYLELRVSPK